MFDKKKNIYETCVLCKCKTIVKKETPIEQRTGYVEGVGQLCSNCEASLKQEQN